MRVTDYNRITGLDSDDILLLDSDRQGTRTIMVSELSKQLNKVLYNMPSTSIPLYQRRMIYRGKNLGNVITEKQRLTILDGEFDDMYIGDYWVLNGRTWLIADFDTWILMYTPDNERIYEHHVTIVNNEVLMNVNMNDTDTTNGGFYNSKMYKTHLQTAINMLKNDFGVTKIMFHPNNASADSAEMIQIDIPTCSMVLGFPVSSDKGSLVYAYNQQLALASLRPSFFTTCALQDTTTDGKGYYNISEGRIIEPHVASWPNYQMRVLIAITGRNIDSL